MEHRSDCEQLIADLVENHFGIEKHLKGSVEHLIRYAIESAYTKNKMNHYFPEVYGRPSNSMAIRQAAEFVRTSET